MTFSSWLPDGWSRRTLATVSYLTVVFGLFAFAGWLAAGLNDEYLETAALRERLQSLEQRAARGAGGAAENASAEIASPFLEGETITQAAAALQRQMERAVLQAGGALRSSEMNLTPSEADPTGAAGQPAAISITADIDLQEPALQAFLYDIEAGMPYLFIDNLTVTHPSSAEESASGQIHVALTASGIWGAHP